VPGMPPVERPRLAQHPGERAHAIIVGNRQPEDRAWSMNNRA
jgi:hypothetical protein